MSGCTADSASSGGLSDEDEERERENDRDMLRLWADADWRRWSSEEPWNWDPAAKRAEAETLWRRRVVVDV